MSSAFSRRSTDGSAALPGLGADNAVESQREFLNTLLENLAEGIVACDAQGVLTIVNRTMREFHGLPPEPIPAERWAEHFDLYLADGQTLIPPEQVPLARALHGEVVRDYEMVIVPKDRLRRRRTIVVNAQPIVAPSGKKLGAVVALHDITQQKRAMAALEASRRRLLKNRQHLAEAQQIANIGSWEWDIKRKKQIWSDELYRIYGFKPRECEITFRLLSKLMHPDDVEMLEGVRQTALRTGQPFGVDHRIVRVDGAVRVLHGQGRVILDKNGEPERMIGTSQDITERKQSEIALTRLNRVHAVSSGINTLIVRVRDRQELFREACRIAVEQGRFELAWVGILNGGGQIHPVARHGLDDGFLESAAPWMNVGSSGRGPEVRALRGCEPCVINDVAADNELGPWREAALQRGYRAVLAYPLTVGGAVVGSISLYAGEAGFFDEEELKLLAELVGDICYAMDFITRSDQLNYLAYYDPLTRLANRSLFTERVNQNVQMARQNQSRLAVLLVNLERFKSVNDTLGVAAGDALLQEVAARLATFAGSATSLARVGADVFAVVVPQVKEVADLSAILREQMLSRLDRPYQLRGQELRISSRIGIALFPDDADDAETLIRNAEAAVKKAKATGERYTFYTPQMTAVLKEKLSMESDLRRALEHQEFVVYYQPRVDLRTGAICGAEALLRWSPPDHALVPPGQFIGALEETGMILDVGRWVVDQAIADRQVWLNQGLSPPRVAVNVSAAQLRQPDFVDIIQAAINDVGGSGPAIDLEVTESVLMTDIEQHIDKLKSLRNFGVSVSIDDFGTGYSSLAYLAKLPISAIKIDRSFIVEMTTSQETSNIVSTIISLAHSMNLDVIAEGVDSPEQLKFLRLLHCDEMQGYLFSRPLPAQEYAQLLRERRHVSLS